MVNIQNALQQALKAAQTAGSNVSGGVKALLDPQSRRDYLTGAEDTLRRRGMLSNKYPQLAGPAPIQKEKFPGYQKLFNQATAGFSPAAMSRAKNIPIRYTPVKGNAQLPIGARALLGGMSKKAAGIYQPNRGGGYINVNTNYKNDPELLRHELIHSMDTNVNYQTPPTAMLADFLPVANKYLSNKGLLDSRGFYPQLRLGDKKYVRRRTRSYDQTPQVLDLEGMAYMGTTGNEYAYPSYIPMTIPQVRE